MAQALAGRPTFNLLATRRQDVDGGASYIGEESRVRFLDEFSSEDVGVGSIANLEKTFRPAGAWAGLSTRRACFGAQG